MTQEFIDLRANIIEGDEKFRKATAIAAKNFFFVLVQEFISAEVLLSYKVSQKQVIKFLVNLMK
ncbi:hypothetical protein H6F74_22115 [Trichocoleus sp. FACHB-90]|uniref:hypothetical protein n=1 Tax=Cyanophyceae TaxID=3028117 RepID=UPI001685EF8F|nr:hypothetical protein [Trichocoleus sp. FACHB-90]MBD1928920.1 hypothetical protein [Trichocoleus sp. FACHB-90]